MSTALSTQTIEELWHLADIDATSENVRLLKVKRTLAWIPLLYVMHDFVMSRHDGRGEASKGASRRLRPRGW